MEKTFENFKEYVDSEMSTMQSNLFLGSLEMRGVELWHMNIDADRIVNEQECFTKKTRKLADRYGTMAVFRFFQTKA